MSIADVAEMIDLNTDLEDRVFGLDKVADPPSNVVPQRLNSMICAIKQQLMIISVSKK